MNDEIEEMEWVKEIKSGCLKSVSNVSSDDSDDDEGFIGGLSVWVGLVMVWFNVGGGGVLYEEFNV